MPSPDVPQFELIAVLTGAASACLWLLLLVGGRARPRSFWLQYSLFLAALAVYFVPGALVARSWTPLKWQCERWPCADLAHPHVYSFATGVEMGFVASLVGAAIVLIVFAGWRLRARLAAGAGSRSPENEPPPKP